MPNPTPIRALPNTDPTGGRGGDLLAERLKEAKLYASEHLIEAVNALVSVMRRSSRNCQHKVTAARELFRVCEGAVGIDPAQVDQAVKVVLVDQSALSAELQKRVAK